MKYPAETLSPAEVAALIGACSHTSASGIRNRALIGLLYRSGWPYSSAGWIAARRPPAPRCSVPCRARRCPPTISAPYCPASPRRPAS